MDFDFDDQPSVQNAPAARAGARFKPKARPVPKKKQVSFSTSQTTNLSTTDSSNEKLSTQSQNPVNRSKEQSVLRACTGKRSDEDITEPPEITNDNPVTQDSTTVGDFVTPETDEDTHAQREEEAEECHLDMETLDIVQEEGTTTNAFEQQSGKFQPKPRVILETVIEEEAPESQSHYSMDDDDNNNNNSYLSNDFNTNTTYNGDLQREEEEVPRETVPEMEVPTTNTTVEEEEQSGKESLKTGKSKRPASRKRKSKIQNDPVEPSENTETKKKKFKHSSRRQKRTLEKELLETPDHEIRHLPIRDMLRLVEYKEWLEKKEAKGAPVVPPTQESNNVNTSENQYYSQDFGGMFDEEDEFAMEGTENHEKYVVEPDLPVNYQTYMTKTSRSRWSKEDTELFYEGISEFGSNLSMVQQLFPSRTREQIKLKFKLEERRHPLKLNDALSSRSKHMIHYQTVIKKLQQEAAAAKEGEEEDEEEHEDGEARAETETTTEVPENEEPTKSEETERAGVKQSNSGDVENGVRLDGGDEEDEEDDDDFWNSYKSEL